MAEQAHRLIAEGAHLISTNSGAWCPTDNGKKAYHVGKPYAPARVVESIAELVPAPVMAAA